MDACFAGSTFKNIALVNLYFLSGLGVDKRVFQKLTLSNNNSIYFLEWIKPLAGESITAYARRIANFIDTSKPFVLIGLSFGGMMAVELNKLVAPHKTILISSASSHKELPWFVKAIRLLPLHKLIPSQVMKRPNSLFYYLFGIKTKKEKAFLKTILSEADPAIINWSIDAVSKWNNETIPTNLVHIHGDCDKLLPAKPGGKYEMVKGGEHFMVYSKAEEVSGIINKILDQPQL